MTTLLERLVPEQQEQPRRTLLDQLVPERPVAETEGREIRGEGFLRAIEETKELAGRVGPMKSVTGTWQQGWVGEYREPQGLHLRSPNKRERVLIEYTLANPQMQEGLQPWELKRLKQAHELWIQPWSQKMDRMLLTPALEMFPYHSEKLIPGVTSYLAESKARELSTDETTEFFKRVEREPGEWAVFMGLLSGLRAGSPFIKTVLSKAPGARALVKIGSKALEAPGVRSLAKSAAEFAAKHPVAWQILKKGSEEAGYLGTATATTGALRAMGEGLPVWESLQQGGFEGVIGAGFGFAFTTAAGVLAQLPALQRMRASKAVLREYEAIRQGNPDPARAARSLRKFFDLARKDGLEDVIVGGRKYDLAKMSAALKALEKQAGTEAGKAEWLRKMAQYKPAQAAAARPAIGPGAAAPGAGVEVPAVPMKPGPVGAPVQPTPPVPVEAAPVPPPTAPAPTAERPPTPEGPAPVEVKEPPIVTEAIERFQREGDRGIDWVWLHMSDPQGQEFERFLVESGHPLAKEPGTPEQRFRTYVQERAGAEPEAPPEPEVKLAPRPEGPQEVIVGPIRAQRAIPQLQEQAKEAIAFVKKFAGAVADFKANPVFKVEVDKDKGPLLVLETADSRFRILPGVVGVTDAQIEELRPGDTVRIDLEHLEPPKTKKLPKELKPGRSTAHELRYDPEGGWWGAGDMIFKGSPPSEWYEEFGEELPDYMRHRLADLAEEAAKQITMVDPPKPLLLFPLDGKPQPIYEIGGALFRADKVEFVEANWTGFAWRLATYKDVPVAIAMTDTPQALLSPLSVESSEGVVGYTVADFEKQGYQVTTGKAPRKRAPKAQASLGVIAPIKEVTLFAEAAEVPVAEGAGEVEAVESQLEKAERPWPKEIKPVGEDFWTELMGVARDLDMPYRYRELRGGLLGAFRPDRPMVEVFDVGWVLTGSHELGHAIDYALNNWSPPSSIQERFGRTKGDRAYRLELVRISKVLRPDLWADSVSAATKAYRAKHTELMGDFLSAYILDPALAHRLAPKVTALFEAKLATNPKVKGIINHLWAVRDEGPDRPAVSEWLTEHFPYGKVHFGLGPEEVADYDLAVKRLGVQRQRDYKAQLYRAYRDAERIDDLALKAAKGDKKLADEVQTDWVAMLEHAEKNHLTGKSIAEIQRDMTPEGRKAVTLARGYFEAMRQAVDKYMRGADAAEWIGFIQDYFIHSYKTPLTERYRTAVSRWAKRTGQTQKRILPTLGEAAQMGLISRAQTLADGIRLWAGINFRVETNVALLQVLPKILNEAGESIVQKVKDKPDWPRLDHPAIRRVYGRRIGNRGVLLWQGQVAVDPEVYGSLDAIFASPLTHRAVRAFSAINGLMKAMELTLFSLFHFQDLLDSGAAALGPRRLVLGLWGKEAERFGAKAKLGGLIPAHVGLFEAGRQLRQVPEFMGDMVLHGYQPGTIGTEGINQLQRIFNAAVEYVERLGGDPGKAKMATGLAGLTPLHKTALAPARWLTKGVQKGYAWTQNLLWNTLKERLACMTYLDLVTRETPKLPPNVTPAQLKEAITQYLADQYGGQEFENTIFRHPKFRQIMSQGLMSLDWTYSQLKVVSGIFRYAGDSKSPYIRALSKKFRFWQLIRYGMWLFMVSQAANQLFSRKFTWENEPGHRWDVDITDLWRSLPWNRDWKERGDMSRRYVRFGKAAREIMGWIKYPLREFGYKLSPLASLIFEQATGVGVGSDFPEPFSAHDLMEYESIIERAKGVGEKFVPFSFRGNQAFLALPLVKGMTVGKAIRAYEEIYKADAKAAMGVTLSKVLFAISNMGQSRASIMRDIQEACTANKVDTEKASRLANTAVRSRYYRLFWQAARKGDVERCNLYAKALEALGVTEKGLLQSARTRAESVQTMRAVGVEADKVIGLKAYQLTEPNLDDEAVEEIVGFLHDNAIPLEEALKHLKMEFRRRGVGVETRLKRTRRLRERLGASQKD